MTQLMPINSMLSRWPSVWDDDDFRLIGSAVGNDIDVFETDDKVVVKANVAGVDLDDIEVTFEKGVLYIQAKARQKQEDEKNKYYSKATWDYSYKVAVPGTIDYAKEPEVTLQNGLLTATFQKSEASKPKRLTVRSA